MEVINYVENGFNDNKQYTISVFADIAKAFNSIDRHLLLKNYLFMELMV